MDSIPNNLSHDFRNSPLDAGQARTLDVAELLGGHRQISLRHGRQEYFLRITRNGKLILTK